MKEPGSIQRFLDAQRDSYAVALNEINNGKKKTHWMWYIFPQIEGLGFSETSKYYAIKDLREAEDFLRHPVLGSRLVRICESLLDLPGKNAHKILGSPDDLKLKSSMTLFASVVNSDPVFFSVLDKFFDGQMDEQTMKLLHEK
jgi:uncharacterized protein (DUF1810 family)